MYAVIKSGGKQYKVAENDVIAVEKMAGEPGDSVNLGHVLMVGDENGQTVGAPTVAGAVGDRAGTEARQEGHRLQAEAAPGLPPQEWPSPEPDRPADYRYHGGRQEKGGEGESGPQDRRSLG